MQQDIITTEDGSHTLFQENINECYHSRHGAIQESSHIFINCGLKQCDKVELQILEIGFGTGLNALLTFQEAEKTKRKIKYTTLELYPLSIEKALQLNYPETLNIERQYFEQIHFAEWNKEVEITPCFSILKIKADFTEYEFPAKYDVVYFDAFSPEKQPEMWSSSCFNKIYEVCASKALLTTYCAKGIVRRTMQAAGFKVERLPGPPGKREILRARK